MGKTAMRMALLGAVAGTVLLAGCGDDNGRSWAMTPQSNYSPYRDRHVTLHRGSNTGFPRVLPRTEPTLGMDGATGVGGSGLDASFPTTQPQELSRREVNLKEDFRVPYPPLALDSEVAQELGTGKPLRASRGAWVQGLFAVELGSGLTTAIPAPASAPAQPQQNPTVAPAAPLPGANSVEVRPHQHTGDAHLGAEHEP